MKYFIGGLIVLFASYTDIFLFRSNIIPVPPSSFLIPLFMGLCLINYSIKDLIDIFKYHSFRILFIVLLFSLIYAGFSKAKSSIITEKIVLNIITLLLYTFILHFFRTESKKTVITVLISSFAVLVGSFFYDFFIGLPNYGQKFAESVRKGGFGENPNQAASGIKFLALAILVLINKDKKLRYIIITLMVAAVFLTLSRSGMASVIFILIFGTMNNWSEDTNLNPKIVITSVFKLVMIFAVLYISLLSFAEIIKENFPAFTRGAAGQRMDMLLGKSEVKIDEGGDSGGRSDLLVMFFYDFLDNPWGRGTGYSSDKNFNRLNSHNYFLYLGINFGILALLFYLFYTAYSLNIAIKYDQFYYLIFTVLIIFECFVSHNIWYTRTLIVCLAFFDSRVYKNINQKRVNYLA